MNFSLLPVAACSVLSQPLLIRHVLQDFNQLLSASPNLFHYVHVFLVLGKLELDAVL